MRCDMSQLIDFCDSFESIGKMFANVTKLRDHYIAKIFRIFEEKKNLIYIFHYFYKFITYNLFNILTICIIEIINFKWSKYILNDKWVD